MVLPMDTSKPQSPKQLKEHLQLHQEPFSLQSYLIERSYMFKNFSSDSNNIHLLCSAKNLKWSIKYDLHKIRERFLHATGILRSILYKFIPTPELSIISSTSWDEENNSDGYYAYEISAETLQQQAPQQTNSLKKYDIEEKALPYERHSSTLVNILRRSHSEVDAGTKPCLISSIENKQQYSRGSEWREPLANAEGQVRGYVKKLSQRVNSNILRLGRAKKHKVEGMVGLETASLCGRNQRILLPFDYVEKDREFHKIEGKSVSTKAVSGSEDLHRIMHMHERFNMLEKQYRHVKKISHLLRTESCVISQEWKNFQIVKWEIHMQIGDSIMDDIVREMIHLF